MKRALTIIALIGHIVCCSFALSATLTGQVVGISDGDTITVLDANKIQHKIRLVGIDAPEKKQPFGEHSKQHLSNLVFAMTVTVEWDKNDKYGRMLGKVIVDGKDANLEQIRAGLAWHYKRYQNEQIPSDRRMYSAAEIDARNRRAGLWRDPRPIPPWNFRHGTGDVANLPLQNINNSCLCNEENYCTGKRGGHYCYSDSGKKRYTR